MSTLNLKPFTTTQQEYIRRGEQLIGELRDLVLRTLGKTDLEYVPKKHLYIIGGSGIGKSLVVRNTAKECKITLHEVTSSISMNVFAGQLATAVHESGGKEVYFWLDDCDSVFLDKTSISVMKAALDADRNVFAWNRNLTSQLLTLENSDSEHDLFMAEALRRFQTKTNFGVEIPTDNVTFIFTTNHTLAKSNPLPKTTRLRDEAAIRSRVEYKTYEHIQEGFSWGWMAATILSAKNFTMGPKKKIAKLTVGQKHILLEYLYTNWSILGNTDLRGIIDLISDMLNFPDSYPDKWDGRLSKIR
jgi:hypothetical protein